MEKYLIFQLLTLLSRKQKISGLRLAMLAIISSLLDFLSIFVFLPLIYLILNPGFVQTNTFARTLYQRGNFNTHTSFLAVILTGILVFLIAKNLAGTWITRLKARYAFGLAHHLSFRSMRHYSQINFTQFLNADFTKELNRIINHPFEFANNLILPVLNLISETFVGLLIVTSLLIYEPPVLIILLAIIAPAMLIFHSHRKYSKKISDTLKLKYPELLKTSLRIIEGYTEIRVFGKEKYFHSKFNEVNRALTDAFVKDHVVQTTTSRVTEVIVGVIICVLITYAIATGETFQELVFLLGVFAASGFRVIPSVNKILLSLQQIRINQHVIQELKFVNSQATCHQNKFTNTRLPFERSIELRSISFAYSYGPPVLKNISLTIRKGDKIAIQGKSGGGKTTLLMLLLQFLKQTSGEILVDGKNIFDEAAWRSNIAYVPQNPYILDGTFLENIAFGIQEDDIDRSRVTRLINDLHLHDLLKQLPDGLQTVIGERGAKLSGGQRQRIALARALYIDADILLLDEITNQVHPALEREILDILHKLSKEHKTIILVTHKLPSINSFNMVCLLENGALIPHLEINPRVP